MCALADGTAWILLLPTDILDKVVAEVIDPIKSPINGVKLECFADVVDSLLALMCTCTELRDLLDAATWQTAFRNAKPKPESKWNLLDDEVKLSRTIARSRVQHPVPYRWAPPWGINYKFVAKGRRQMQPVAGVGYAPVGPRKRSGVQLAYIGWYFASRAERVTATVADTEYRVRFADRGFLEYSDWKCAMGMAKLYSKRSILRIARRQQLGPRTTLAVSVVRELCRALGISYTSAERCDTLMRRVAAVLRREM